MDVRSSVAGEQQSNARKTTTASVEDVFVGRNHRGEQRKWLICGSNWASLFIPLKPSPTKNK